MVRPNTIADAQARAAADRIEAARAAGEQLALLLPDEGPKGEVKRGRGAGKATSQMRDWLAAKGFRMPEDVLAEMAGLSVGEDAFMTAMHRAEQVLAWAQGNGGAATPAQRLDTFKFCLTAALRSAEALVPYGLGKVTPDAAPAAAVQVFVAGATASHRPAQARDVTPQGRKIAPPPMPGEIQQYQQVSDADLVALDADIRTEGPTP